MSIPVIDRVRSRRAALRAAGLRPVLLWVPDTRRTGFAQECRRQAGVVAAIDATDPDLAAALDAAWCDLSPGG